MSLYNFRSKFIRSYFFTREFLPIYEKMVLVQNSTDFDSIFNGGSKVCVLHWQVAVNVGCSESIETEDKLLWQVYLWYLSAGSRSTRINLIFGCTCFTRWGVMYLGAFERGLFCGISLQWRWSQKSMGSPWPVYKELV